MKKVILHKLILMAALAMLLAGCSEGPSRDRQKEEAIRNYCATIGEDADAYFIDLSTELTGITPEQVTYSLNEFTADEILAAEPVDWQEMITSGKPELIVGLSKVVEHRKDEDYYTDEQIHDMLAEVVNRGLIVDLYFDNPRLVYIVRSDGIQVDKQEAADGGAYHQMYDYEL